LDEKNIQSELAGLKPGDHLCMIYGTEEEHRSVVVPYIRQGLEGNEKIIYVADASAPEDIMAYLAGDGLDGEPYIGSGQLTIMLSRDFYLGGGVFDPDLVMKKLKGENEKALAGGFSALRVTGEMSWVLKKIPGRERLTEYEAMLNNFFPGSSTIAMCQYDRAIFKPEAILDIFYSHPIVCVSGEIFKNIYYMPPSEVRPEKVFTHRFDRWVGNLKTLKMEKEKADLLMEEKSMLLGVEKESRQALLSMVEDLQKAEEDLQESELNFRTLADSGRALIWTSGTDRKCNYFNQPWLDFTGRTIEQEIGDGWTEGVHPDDLGTCIKTYTESFDKREPFSMVYRLRNKDGVYRWVQDDGTPRYDLRCDFTGYIGHCLDITELKEAEARIFFIKKLLEGVQKINQFIIKRTGFETAVLLKQVCRVLHKEAGYPVVLAGQVRKKPHGIIFTEKEGLAGEFSEEITFTSGEAEFGENPVLAAVIKKEPVICRDMGKTGILASLMGEAVKRKCTCCMWLPIVVHGDAAGVLLVCSDRSPGFDEEEKAILEELSYGISMAWETAVSEGERRILTEQLVRAEKLAAVGELIAGVAHEINNPLTGIVGFAELLLLEDKKKLDGDTRKGIEHIYKSSERICKIVSNLLRFSRREAPMRKNIPVSRVIDRVLDIRDYEMLVRNIKLQKNYQQGLPNIMGDPSQLEQVFLNLINNAEYAIRETGENGVLTVNIYGEEGSGGEGNVVVEIADTGTGIPEKILNKLFDPFFTTKPVGKGTGLGLSVSYGIVKEHGGEITAFNRKEGGAVFKVKLPVRGKPDGD